MEWKLRQASMVMACLCMRVRSLLYFVYPVAPFFFELWPSLFSLSKEDLPPQGDGTVDWAWFEYALSTLLLFTAVVT